MEHTCLRQNSTTDRNGAGSLLVESKLLLCTNTDEVNTGISSPDSLAENHKTQQDESGLVCLSYDHNVRSWLIRKPRWPMRRRRCSWTCGKPLRSFTRRYGLIHRLRNQVGRTRTQRKPCLTNCTTVPAWCGF